MRFGWGIGMTQTAAATGEFSRVSAIDILRGLVIVLMALDHTREFTNASGWAFNPLSAEDSTPLLYVTRWVTHLCAPTFVLLAGVSARLQGMRGLTRGALSRRLLTRGLWLVFLELTLIGFAWSFSLPFLQFWQVIWAIGWSMVLLAGLVWLPPVVSLIVGAAIIATTSVLVKIPAESFGDFELLWSVVYRGVAFVPSFEAPFAFIAYSIIPWFGVMALGYGIGGIFASPKRTTWLLALGALMIVAFLVLRLPNLYGDPRPWEAGADGFWTFAAFMDVTKNPPSLSFVLVTLGIVFLLTPALERLPKTVAGFFIAFGSVPLMAYVAHIVVMHLYAIGVRLIAGADLAAMTDTMRAFIFEPERFGTFSLPIGWVYGVWLAVLATIYPLCRYWSGVKRRRRDWWLSYL
jgi:uncharacterized membrane protein